LDFDEYVSFGQVGRRNFASIRTTIKHENLVTINNYISMTIAQALKEKNKKVATINVLYDRLYKNNSVLDGNRRSYNPIELLATIETEMDELIDLKTKIHNASAPVRGQIFRLSELKTKVVKLRYLDTSEGPVRDKYDGTVTRRQAMIQAEQVDVIADVAQQEIEEIQEALDKFNFSTLI